MKFNGTITIFVILFSTFLAGVEGTHALSGAGHGSLSNPPTPKKVFLPGQMPPVFRRIKSEDSRRGQWFSGFGSGMREGLALGRRSGNLDLLEFQIRQCTSLRPKNILQCTQCVSVKKMVDCKYPCIKNHMANFCEPPSPNPTVFV